MQITISQGNGFIVPQHLKNAAVASVGYPVFERVDNLWTGMHRMVQDINASSRNYTVVVDEVRLEMVYTVYGSSPEIVTGEEKNFYRVGDIWYVPTDQGWREVEIPEGEGLLVQYMSYDAAQGTGRVELSRGTEEELRATVEAAVTAAYDRQTKQFLKTQSEFLRSQGSDKALDRHFARENEWSGVCNNGVLVAALEGIELPSLESILEWVSGQPLENLNGLNTVYNAIEAITAGKKAVWEGDGWKVVTV